jgi:predicted amidophosphoribosyltransferase
MVFHPHKPNIVAMKKLLEGQNCPACDLALSNLIKFSSHCSANPPVSFKHPIKVEYQLWLVNILLEQWRNNKKLDLDMTLPVLWDASVGWI